MMKKGDKVQVITDLGDCLPRIGAEGTVSGFGDIGPVVLFSNNETWLVHRDAVKLVAAGIFSTQPTNNGTRKDRPVFSGVMQYFPDALLEVALHSKKGNDKHNPGEPLRWAKEKSTDQADCVARHLIDIGPNWDAIDEETQSYHATALAWRALALLQTVLERKK